MFRKLMTEIDSDKTYEKGAEGVSNSNRDTN
jgi:hypothetical protein